MNEQERLAAILRKADPANNPSYQERKVALDMAHKAMDKTGMSYASVGFSPEDAARIENQLSVTTGGSSQRKEKNNESWSIFKPSTSNDIERSTHRKTGYSEPKRRPAVREQYESYVDRCEREEREDFDKRYDAWVSWRKQENAKEAEQEAFGLKAGIVVIAIMVLCVSFVIITALQG